VSVLACGDEYIYDPELGCQLQFVTVRSVLCCRQTDAIIVSPQRKNGLDESLARYKEDAENLQRRICELELGDQRR
jgi:hypothetical protein